MKIAILATEYLKDYLTDATQALELGADTEIFVFYNYVHIVELYKQIEGRFDGFITTGPVPMQTIKKSVPNCKPLSFFLCTDSNYYKIFFEVIYKYNDWNFEHGYFDFCDYLCPNDESSLISYLENGTFKEWLDKNNKYMSEMTVEEMLEGAKNKLQKHRDLWNSGKIKYSLSRMSPIMPEILESGVNCYYISFSHDDIKRCFKELTQNIEVSTLKNSKPCAIDIALQSSPKSEDLSTKSLNAEYDILERLLIAFNKRYMYDFIIRDTRYGFRISTNNKVVEKITDNFTSCVLREYIKENGNLNVAIGYGLGKDLSQAEAGAINACKESRIGLYQSSYLINENRDIICLFGKGNDLSIHSTISLYMREISDRTGLSTLTIQKLSSALKIIGTEEVTTQDLARVLHITIRSVNRIITSLLKYNLAHELYSKQNNTKGRPSKVYKILLDPDK